MLCCFDMYIQCGRSSGAGSIDPAVSVTRDFHILNFESHAFQQFNCQRLKFEATFLEGRM